MSRWYWYNGWLVFFGALLVSLDRLLGFDWIAGIVGAAAASTWVAFWDYHRSQPHKKSPQI